MILNLFLGHVCRKVARSLVEIKRVGCWAPVNRYGSERVKRDAREEKKYSEGSVRACNQSLLLTTRGGGRVKDTSKWSSVQINMSSIY